MAKIFKKKIKCRCGKKVDENYEYCPYCGSRVKEQKQRKQNLDKAIKDMQSELGMPFLMKFPFEKLMKNMIKELDKQFQDFDKEMPKSQKSDIKETKSGISINIKSGPSGEPIIQVKHMAGPGQIFPGLPGKRKKIKEEKQIIFPEKKLTEAQQKKLAKLPKSEPITTVRRLTDKIVYEIELPGVKNKDNIIINKFENSIEIKAFSKDKIYFKLIPVSLPIKNYKVEKEKLILELKP